jgi:FixJ family two-component response regulator
MPLGKAMSRPGTVFVVDESAALRGALCRLLAAAGHRAEPFESAQQYLEVLEQRGSEDPGCLLLDLDLPGIGGLDLQRKLVSWGLSRPVVFLTGDADVQQCVAAMKAGAVDYLTKPVDGTRLIGAVEEALRLDAVEREERTLQNSIRRRLLTLTFRERQVMEQVARGKLNKQIAVQLGIGEKTVKVHRARVMSKMIADSVPELVRFAARVGIANDIALR